MSGTIGTLVTDGGNTNSPSDTNKKENKKHRSYVLTINNPDISGKGMAQYLDTLGTKYVFQLEQGEATKVPHFQMLLNFENARSFNSMKKLFPTAHIEKAKCLKQAVKYCQKMDTRIDGPWISGFPNFNVNVITDLREWQWKFLSEVYARNNDRRVFWIFDEKGGSGKTALAKWLVCRKDALYVSGKAADIKYALSEHLEEKEIKMVIFDYPRSQKEYISYGAIEEVKNGLFFSNKYESKMSIFNPPIVIIFANFLPDVSQLSLDRWQRYHLNDNVLTRYQADFEDE